MQAIRPRADAIRAAQRPNAPLRAPRALKGPSARVRVVAKGEEGASCSSSSSSFDPSSSSSSSNGLWRRDLNNDDGVARAPATMLRQHCNRRQALVAAAAIAAAATLVPSRAANAADAATTTLEAPTLGASDPTLEPFLDNDWSISYPRDYTYREDLSAPPQRDPSRPGGPAPARSPLRARFDAPPLPSTGAPAALLSVIVRQAQTLKPTLVQVADISAFGSPEEAAKLLLPRGARLVAASSAQEASPPRETPLGPVEIPPVNYYYYEFIAPNGGERAVLAAAAAKGKVYVAGGSATVAERGGWEVQSAALGASVRTFRLRNQVAIALEQVQQQQQARRQ